MGDNPVKEKKVWTSNLTKTIYTFSKSLSNKVISLYFEFWLQIYRHLFIGRFAMSMYFERILSQLRASILSHSYALSFYYSLNSSFFLGKMKVFHTSFIEQVILLIYLLMHPWFMFFILTFIYTRKLILGIAVTSRTFDAIAKRMKSMQLATTVGNSNQETRLLMYVKHSFWVLSTTLNPLYCHLSIRKYAMYMYLEPIKGEYYKSSLYFEFWLQN